MEIELESKIRHIYLSLASDNKEPDYFFLYGLLN